jgi:hypothetical protein
MQRVGDIIVRHVPDVTVIEAIGYDIEMALSAGTA